MMMMTLGKFKVLKQPILSIGFFRFVIMDDDELNSLDRQVTITLFCMSHSQGRPSFPRHDLRYAGQIALGKKLVQASRHETHP